MTASLLLQEGGWTKISIDAIAMAHVWTDGLVVWNGYASLKQRLSLASEQLHLQEEAPTNAGIG